MDRPDTKALEETLEHAGVSRPSARKLHVLDFSNRNKARNRLVHDSTNRLLLDLVSSNDVGTCIHVTGEMRAITDPLHRQVCETISLRKGEGFDILYNLPPALAADVFGTVGWNLDNWNKKSPGRWQERLSAIDLIANGGVDLFAYDTSDLIQYSVFGHRYILLQEKHSATAQSKRVWLLDSPKVHDVLACKAEQILDLAMDVDETYFKTFTLNLSGVAARRYLNRLQRAGALSRDVLLDDRLVQELAPDPLAPLDALSMMDFVQVAGDRLYRITPAGEEFLAMLSLGGVPRHGE
ncbi:MAG TPA: hypothetical protein VG326_10935 [Tepidisphaeraceae bacterium]|jgi:hypothetical protein|nr:hypothetical protein [Tepidisphaeraceae bacterium]